MIRELVVVELAPLRLLIRRLADAEIADSWKGGGHPDDIEEIEEDVCHARLDLENFLEEHKKL